jgi:superfamily I DNA/RNA helicase
VGRPYRHDHYLKFWQLNDPRIPGDFILFDEGQDASPVMLDAVAQQDAQLVVVGDTQQQIYEWRGAVNALAQVDGDKAFLTQSFRFGQPIAELANEVLSVLGAELRLTGSPTIESAVGRVMHAHVVLARSNAVAVESVLSLQRTGYKTHLVGGGEDVVAFAKAASMLMDGDRPWHPDLACFDSWGEVQDYVANDPQGDELKVLANLVDEYGVDIILQALEQTTAEAAADVVVSTAHKSKGREWGRVRLAGDFPGEVDPTQPGELRLLYVAATRAANRLDVTACGALSSLLPR